MQKGTGGSWVYSLFVGSAVLNSAQAEEETYISYCRFCVLQTFWIMQPHLRIAKQASIGKVLALRTYLA